MSEGRGMSVVWKCEFFHPVEIPLQLAKDIFAFVAGNRDLNAGGFILFVHVIIQDPIALTTFIFI